MEGGLGKGGSRGSGARSRQGIRVKHAGGRGPGASTQPRTLSGLGARRAPPGPTLGRASRGGRPLGGAGLGAGPGSRGPGRGRARAAQPRGGRRACGTHQAAAGAAATPGSMKDRTQELRTVSPAPARRRPPPVPRAGHSAPGPGGHRAAASASPTRAGESVAGPGTRPLGGSHPSDFLGVTVWHELGPVDPRAAGWSPGS